MDEKLEHLKFLANIAREKYLEIKFGGKDLARKISRGAYGHQSSYMDVVVENSIIEYIENEDLPYNVFTEEAGKIDRGYEETIIIDPIDGSHNAEHGIPFFSVSLAISKGSLSSVEVGLVKNIPQNVNYWAIKGGGAYRNGERIKTRRQTNLFVIYLGKNASEIAYQTAQKAKRVRDLGCASLEMITVAEGIADLFMYHFKKRGALRIVDIAASTLIVREAGGMVLDDSMNELEMKQDFSERKNVIAVSSRSILEVLE